MSAHHRKLIRRLRAELDAAGYGPSTVRAVRVAGRPHSPRPWQTVVVAGGIKRTGGPFRTRSIALQTAARVAHERMDDWRRWDAAQATPGGAS